MVFDGDIREEVPAGPGPGSSFTFPEAAKATAPAAPAPKNKADLAPWLEMIGSSDDSRRLAGFLLVARAGVDDDTAAGRVWAAAGGPDDDPGAGTAAFLDRLCQPLPRAGSMSASDEIETRGREAGHRAAALAVWAALASRHPAAATSAAARRATPLLCRVAATGAWPPAGEWDPISAPAGGRPLPEGAADDAATAAAAIAAGGEAGLAAVRSAGGAAALGAATARAAAEAARTLANADNKGGVQTAATALGTLADRLGALGWVLGAAPVPPEGRPPPRCAAALPAALPSVAWALGLGADAPSMEDSTTRAAAARAHLSALALLGPLLRACGGGEGGGSATAAALGARGGRGWRDLRRGLAFSLRDVDGARGGVAGGGRPAALAVAALASAVADDAAADGAGTSGGGSGGGAGTGRHAWIVGLDSATGEGENDELLPTLVEARRGKWGWGGQWGGGDGGGDGDRIL